MSSTILAQESSANKATSRTGPPLFLVGSERSGTTALRLMLNHHPKIGWLNEFEYAVDQLTDPSAWPDMKMYHDWLRTHRIFQATKLQIPPELDYPALIKSFLEQSRRSFERPFMGANVHRNFDRLLRIWPDAKFLHIVRDPRDVARSCIGMGWAGNVWRGIDRWIEAENTWQELQGQLQKDAYLEFRFEDVIQRPEEALAAICAFIGVEYREQMLTYHADTT